MLNQTVEINSYEVDTERFFTKKEVRKMLEIKHYCTFEEYLTTLEINQRLGWREIKEILALKLFLGAHWGYHSHAMYANLRRIPGAVEKVFNHYGINPDREFRNLYEQYKQQTQAFQISSAIPKRRGADGRFGKSRKPKQRQAS